MPSLKNPFTADERKRLALAMFKLPPAKRERLLELEAKRRGLVPRKSLDLRQTIIGFIAGVAFAAALGAVAQELWRDGDIIPKVQIVEAFTFKPMFSCRAVIIMLGGHELHCDTGARRK